MKRILIIGMHDKIGGVETFLMNYYKNIDRSKIQFDFINMYNNLCFESEIVSLGGKIFKVCNVKKNPLKYYRELRKIIALNTYDIVHINLLSAANIIPVLAAKKAKVKNIIAHSHNSNTPNGVFRKILDKLNKKILLKSATDFFACSKLAGEWMFGDKVNFQIIRNAIDIEKYAYDEEVRNNIRKKLKIENKFVIGNIGRFAYQKNHTFLIEIFYEIQKKHENSILLLIGEGDLKEEITQKVRQMGISDKVMFLGTTSEIWKYLQAMDSFVLPSRFEGLPVTGIEAQANGVECFFSDSISNEILLNDNAYQISLEKGAEYWAEKILSSTHQRVEGVLKEYSIKEIAKELQERYENMGEDYFENKCI